MNNFLFRVLHQNDVDNKKKQSSTSAVFLNLCCGMTGSFHKMLTVMSAGGECKGASMSSS